ncbi:hypothetical protein [Streptomyces tubercidicus]|uniref:hypothetical protein n=1 Tax=Streptomyces tubercidicus TaxID=47759 RepID=UPI0036900514
MTITAAYGNAESWWGPASRPPEECHGHRAQGMYKLSIATSTLGRRAGLVGAAGHVLLHSSH